MSSSVAASVTSPEKAGSQIEFANRPQAISLSARLISYTELAKPRIALMVLLSMSVGYLLAGSGQWKLWPLLHAGFGVFLAVVAASALNQAIEIQTDALMRRTRTRPLPGARLTRQEVLLFAFVCSVVSLSYLLITVNVTTALLTALTILLYAGVYTPLKRYTPLCTVVGAIPGAAPPVLGWTAAGGELNLTAFSLFAILFVWQFPHFLAIAWMYKDEYIGAGLKMLPGAGRRGMVGPIAFGYALVLIPVSMLPHRFDLAGDFYAGVAMTLGLLYAVASLRFSLDESRISARRVLFASLIYLPGVLIALTFDHFRLLNLFLR